MCILTSSQLLIPCACRRSKCVPDMVRTAYDDEQLNHSYRHACKEGQMPIHNFLGHPCTVRALLVLLRFGRSRLSLDRRVWVGAKHLVHAK